LFLQNLWLPFNGNTYARVCDGHHHAYAHEHASPLNVCGRVHRAYGSFPYAHARAHAYPCYDSTFIITSLSNYMYITKMALSAMGSFIRNWSTWSFKRTSPFIRKADVLCLAPIFSCQYRIIQWSCMLYQPALLQLYHV
jgi:hypothetical protein